MTSQEQRRHPRIALHRRCWCESGSITIYAQLQNISEGGLFVRTSAPLREGARATVRWALGEEQDEIEALAVVVWRRPEDGGNGGPAGMGLMIEAIEPDEQARLRAFIEAQPASRVV
jgi:uncharacterized protein (TIGR02266 family)